ncbi:MAG: metalloregulator ArsR/SmtB family transcription factor [Thermomicrobiales bacterium]
MVEQLPVHLDVVFHALSDQTRRSMLTQLADGERSIGELAAPYAMSLAAASKHVKSLERAGLIDRRRAGRSYICRINTAPLAEAQAFLRYYEHFWTTRLDTLHDMFATPANQTEEEA